MKKKVILVIIIIIAIIAIAFIVINVSNDSVNENVTEEENTELVTLPTNEENQSTIEVSEPEVEEKWEWQKDTPNNHNIDEQVLEEVHDILDEYPINAEVNVKDGVIVDEYYKDGYDENSVFTLQSTSKSITSAIFGIAIDKGYIEGVDVPISTYFPEILESDSEYKKQYLFDPLDIESAECTTDPQGISDGGNGFALNIYDMAKIGELYLNNGVWNGEQIIPVQWVEDSTSVQFTRSSGTANYGYQWWVRHFGDENYDVYFAQGHYGQYIFVVPDLELVVAITSHYEGSTSIYWQIMNDIVNGCK